MLCPNCNATHDFGNKCPYCKVDAVLYKRTSRLSERLYNHGLERLRASDLTHGIEALTKSVAVDKSNVTARNLLGLALFEIGHVGDALMHWVISNSIYSENNPAEKYLERANKDTKQLEKYNDAISMYNIALGHIKHKSDDLAVIQLKRVVDINPKFIDALNLLTLCYLIQNDGDRAAAISERVLSIDIQNPIAFNYLSKTNPKSKSFRKVSSVKTMPRVSDSNGPYKSIDAKDKKNISLPISEILAIIVTASAIIAIIYFLVYPQIVRNHEGDIYALEATVLENEIEHAENIAALNVQIEELQAAIRLQNSTIIDFEQTIELQNRINQVHIAYRLYQDEQLQEAINILDELDTSGISNETQNLIDEMRTSAYPQLATIYLNQGQIYFNEPDLYRAIQYLEKTARFISDEMTTQRRDFLYMLGTIYFEEGRHAEALILLEELSENFSTHFQQRVNNMINTINEQI